MVFLKIPFDIVRNLWYKNKALLRFLIISAAPFFVKIFYYIIWRHQHVHNSGNQGDR